MSVTSGIKSYFLRGLAVLLPTILTLWIFIWGFTFIQGNISVHINKALVWLTMKAKGLDWSNDATRQVWEDFWVSGWGSIAGFIIALVVVCVVGVILASVVGRGLWRYIERLILNAPFLRRVYPYIKQITDFLLVQNKTNKLFLRVVGVEYPRRGIWSIGFVTGEGLAKLVNNNRRDFLTILIPTSPTPFTGFVIMVPEDEVIDLDITVEEAMRMTISAGVISPATKFESVVVPLPLDEKDRRGDSESRQATAADSKELKT